MRVTSLALSLEGGLVCPTWVSGPAGPYSGPHPRVSLPEPPARTTMAESQGTINSKLCLCYIVQHGKVSQGTLALCSGKIRGLRAGATCPGLSATSCPPRVPCMGMGAPTSSSPTAGKGGVARAQEKHPMPGLSPAALTLGHPHTPRLDSQTLLSVPTNPSQLPSQPFFSSTKGIQPVKLVPAARASRSEARVGHCVTVCMLTGSSVFWEVGIPTCRQRGAMSEDNSPVRRSGCGGTSQPLAWSQMGAAGRILAPPDSSPGR